MSDLRKGLDGGIVEVRYGREGLEGLSEMSDGTETLWSMSVNRDCDGGFVEVSGGREGLGLSFCLGK